MKRFIIVLLIGLLLLGFGIAVRSKYSPILNRGEVHYCEQCYDGQDDVEYVTLNEGTVLCGCGSYIDAGESVYTNKHLIEEDWEIHGDLYRNCVYSIIFGGIVLLLGVMDGLREWSEKNGC